MRRAIARALRCGTPPPLWLSTSSPPSHLAPYPEVYTSGPPSLFTLPWQPAVICHGAGDAPAQYGAYAEWAKATRATPSLVVAAFTSLTLEVSRALLRLPKRSFGQWRDGGYDPSHIPKAHHCLQLLETIGSDFPTAALVLFTDDIHFERTRHILHLAGKDATPMPPEHTRVLASAKQLELQVRDCFRWLPSASERVRVSPSVCESLPICFGCSDVCQGARRAGHLGRR